MYKKIGYGLSLSIHVLVVAFLLLPNFQRKRIPQDKPISVSIIGPQKHLHKKKTLPKPIENKSMGPQKKPQKKALYKKMDVQKKKVPRKQPAQAKQKAPIILPKKTSKPLKKVVKPLKKTPQKNIKPTQKDIVKNKVDDDFMKVLKSLEKVEPAVAQPEASITEASSQHIEDLLSDDELACLKEQLKGCWHVPAGARHAQDLAVELKVKLSQDATVLSVQTLNPKPKDEFFIVAEESARRALMSPDCTPLEMPKGKFDVWQESIFTFDPKEIL